MSPEDFAGFPSNNFLHPCLLRVVGEEELVDAVGPKELGEGVIAEGDEGFMAHLMFGAGPQQLLPVLQRSQYPYHLFKYISGQILTVVLGKTLPCLLARGPVAHRGFLLSLLFSGGGGGLGLQNKIVNILFLH